MLKKKANVHSSLFFVTFVLFFNIRPFFFVHDFRSCFGAWFEDGLGCGWPRPAQAANPGLPRHRPPRRHPMHPTTDPASDAPTAPKIDPAGGRSPSWVRWGVSLAASLVCGQDSAHGRGLRHVFPLALGKRRNI